MERPVHVPRDDVLREISDVTAGIEVPIIEALTLTTLNETPAEFVGGGSPSLLFQIQGELEGTHGVQWLPRTVPTEKAPLRCVGLVHYYA